MKNAFRLSFVLAKNSIKVKNEYNILGFFWYIIDPLFLFFIFMVIRGNLGRNSEFVEYPIYLFLGLIMFNFFRRCTSSSIASVISKGKYLKTMNINKEALVVSNILINIFSHIFEVIILIILIFIFGDPGLNILYYIPIFFILLLFTSGVSFVVSVIGVYIRDFNGFWRMFTRMLWFLTPVFYVVIPGNLIYTLNQYNPMYHIIEFGRLMILNSYQVSYVSIWASIIISITTLFVGLFIFRKNKNNLVELL